jgi:hypothetical protein
MPSFYQDRLGTNIGKAEKEVRVLAGSCKLLDSEGEWCYDAGEKRPLFFVPFPHLQHDYPLPRQARDTYTQGQLTPKTAFRFVSFRYVSFRLVSSRLVFKQSPDP